MDLIHQYKEHVKWCKNVGTHSMGFLNWKAEKFGYLWDNKNKKYIKIKDENNNNDIIINNYRVKLV